MTEHHTLAKQIRLSGPNGGRSVNSMAEEICVNPRTLRKWEAGESKAPDTICRLMAMVVALDMLEALERAGPESLREALGGEPNITRIREFIDAVFDEHDPLNERLSP